MKNLQKARGAASARRMAAALFVGASTGALALFTAVPAQAQQVNAALRGQITGGTVQQVTAVQVGTGIRRTSQVGADGRYSFASLSPGEYRLEIVTSTGTVPTDVFSLQVAQNAVLDFDLAELGVAPAVGPEVGVGAPAPADGNVILVTANRIRSLEGGEVGVVISRREIETLPQNNRNFLAFADTAPGVQFITDGGGNSRLQGGGQNSRTVNVFIDGIGQKDYVLKNGVTGQDTSQGNPFPQLAIGEYRVISSNYKAEFDQVSSVAITAVTRSGGNRFEAEGFVDFSNQDLRAKTAIEEEEDREKVQTRDLQFGGALAGPIIEDSLFFFLSYEGKRIESPREIIPGGGLTVDAFPAQYRDVFGQVTNTFREDLYFGKIDVVPTDRDLVQLSLKYRDETTQSISGGANAATYTAPTLVKEWRGLFRYERTEDNWINDLKVAYENVNWAPTPLLFENGRIFENVNGNRLLGIGGSPNFQDKGQKGWTLQNDLTWVGFAGHIIKTGVKAKFVELNTLQQNLFNPQYTFNSDFGPGFNDTIPYRLQFGALTGVNTPNVRSNNFQFGIYIQDDWEVTDRLTLNLGLRWDYERTPAYLDYEQPADAIAAVSPGNYPNLQNADYDISEFISTGSERDAFLGAFQPRVGFSYRVDDEGLLTVFGGYGRSYDRNQFDFLQQEIAQGAFATRSFNFRNGDPVRDCAPVSSTCLPFDPIYLTSVGRDQLLAGTPLGAGGREIRFITNDLKLPYSDQFSLGVRSNFNLFELELGYRHINSYDGFAYLLGNRRLDGSFFPANAPPNSPFGFAPPGWGSIIIGTNGLETREDVGHFKLTKRYTQFSPWSLTATYTYTEAEENRAFGETFSLDFPSIEDYPFARSSGVPKHRLVMTGSVDGPLGITLGGKFQIQSPPFLKGFLNQQQAPFERLVVGTVAESLGDWRWGRRQLDLSATKYFGLPFVLEDSSIWMRLDVINVLNDRNYTNFNGNVNDTTREPNSPTIFGERVGFGTGGNPPRTLKVSAGFRF